MIDEKKHLDEARLIGNPGTDTSSTIYTSILFSFSARLIVIGSHPSVNCSDFTF